MGGRDGKLVGLNVKTICWLLVVFVAVVGGGGCVPAAFVDGADREVGRLLRDRQRQTLAYEPQTTAPSDIPMRPTTHAYARIPATPVPPASQSAIERTRIDVPVAPLGPEIYWGGRYGPIAENAFDGLDLIRARASQSYRLGPPAPGEGAVHLDFFKSLEYAVQRSRDYQTRMEQVYVTALTVTLERHLFAPRPFANVSVGFDGGQQDINYRSALSATAQAGVRQQLPYGGEIVASTLVSFVNALNDNTQSGESATVALAGSIPLLRGAGLVNLEPLIQSERDLVYQIRSFEEYRRQFLVDVASRYFSLLTRQQSVDNSTLNYLNLTILTERTAALYAAGRISFLEVQRSLQAQLQAESRLVDAIAAYQQSLDDFKIILGMAVETDLAITGVALEVDIPHPDPEQAVAMAREYRLDLRTAQDRIEDARRGVGIAGNGLLPDLGLSVGADLGNRAGASAGELDSRALGYRAAVRLDLPLDRLAERNTYRRSVIQFHQAQRGYRQLEEVIAADVRDALRGINAAENNLRIQQSSIDLANRRIDYANELLKEGKVTARDVVEAQSSLLTAQDGYDRAKASLQSQVLQYLRDTGTLRLDPRAGSLAQAMDRRALLGGGGDLSRLNIHAPREYEKEKVILDSPTPATP